MAGQGDADIQSLRYFYCSEGFSPVQAGGVGYFLWLEVTVHHMAVQRLFFMVGSPKWWQETTTL